jgi:PIN domain nuclease of toxin-antitoxin system
MKVLLDTCAFIWANLDSPRLSPTARSVLADEENEVYLSVVSCWEIAIKSARGTLPLPGPAEVYVPQAREKNGIRPLPLDEESALHVSKLPALHNDPFDRMLICQAMVHGMVLLTPDPAIVRYPVRSLW